MKEFISSKFPCQPVLQNILGKSLKNFCEGSLACNSTKNYLLHRYFTRILIKFYMTENVNKIVEKHPCWGSDFSKDPDSKP